MRNFRSLTIAVAILSGSAILAPLAAAQTARQSKRQAAETKPVTPPKPAAIVAEQLALNPPVAPPPPSPLRPAPIEQKCLRALNGACTNPVSVEAARLRAEIIPAVRVSYFGTPAGTIGGDYIPFERLFQDNSLVFGLPTFTFVQPCCVSRTK